MDISKTVYSLYYPETRKIVDSLWSSRPHEWYEDNYTKKQNDMHEPFLSTWADWMKIAGVTIGDMKYQYPVNGASEAIFHLMAYYASHPYSSSSDRVFHVFEGEYEGYRKNAEALGAKVVVHSRTEWDIQTSPSDVFFISQPSAIDGNVWHEFNDWVNMMEKFHPSVSIVVDLTYIGCANNLDPANLHLAYPNIDAVVWSLSKPFGVYYHRIGDVFSRMELPSLYGNFWFKNLFSLHLGEALMKAYMPTELPKKYRALQENTITRLIYEGTLHQDTKASDVVLLAHNIISPFILTDDEYVRTANDKVCTARYCLTPSLDRIINK